MPTQFKGTMLWMPGICGVDTDLSAGMIDP
jgi:hypothetical protein